MTSISISFDPNINWKCSYRRNNKTTQNKHVLCFPDHLSFNHRVFMCKYSYRTLDFAGKIYLSEYLIIQTIHFLYVDISHVIQIWMI